MLNLKPLASVAVANAMMAMPAMAGTGKLFDFNATLPIMAAQFLLLMVFLDKTWFTPVGKVLDDRDELIRSKLAAVQGDTSSLTEMQDQAEKVIKEARAAASAAVADARATTQAEQNEKLAVLKAVRPLSGRAPYLSSAAALSGIAMLQAFDATPLIHHCVPWQQSSVA